MSRVDTALSGVFGLPQEEKTELPVVVIPEHDETTTQLQSDVDFVRNKLHSLINKGESAMEVLTDIAKSEESPRSFEVLNAMLNTLSSMSLQLIDIHIKQQKLEASKPEEDAPTKTVNNNVVFVGTTNDMQTQIMNRLKAKQQ
jgi:hypothetical protein